MPARSPSLAIALLLLSFRASANPLQPSKPSQAALAASTPTDLGAEIATLLGDPAVSHAHWGISVTQLDGTPVYTLDADKLFRPASTAKLFTTAAAMALLGPDHRFLTRVYGDLDTSGTVQGDLVLVGGGDPSFETHDLPYSHTAEPPRAAAPASDDLTGLAQQLASAGVKHVTGSLLGEDTLFERASVPDGWAAEDLLWGYGTLPSALSVGDNELQVTVAPAQHSSASAPPDSPAGSLVTVAQLVPWLQITNDVSTGGAPGHAQGVDAQPTASSPQGVRLFGSLAPEAAPVHEHLALVEPAAYAAAALRSTLALEGIEVQGGARASHQPPPTQPSAFLAGLHHPGCETSLWAPGSQGTQAHPPLQGCAAPCPAAGHPERPLAEHASAPLSDDVTFTLKTSANLHAELFLHHLGLLAACPGVTTLGGARVLRDWLVHIGLGDGTFVLYDGSGLSTKDLVTPGAESQLLSYAAAQPWFPLWFAALPVGGVDGTLSTRFPTAPLRGHVFAKTGTLGESRALAGFLDCRSGKRLIFSILVDNHQPGSAADRMTMDKIVAAIASLN